MAGCSFEPDIDTLEIPTPIQQPFGDTVPGEGGSAEITEEDVQCLLDELFNPYNLPLGPRDVTLTMRMDEILAGAYAYYGYDLAAIAAAGQENPLTEDQFEAYLVAEGLG